MWRLVAVAFAVSSFVVISGCDRAPTQPAPQPAAAPSLKTEAQIRAEVEAKLRAEAEAEKKVTQAKAKQAAEDELRRQRERFSQLQAYGTQLQSALKTYYVETLNKKVDNGQSSYAVGAVSADIRKTDSLVDPVIGEIRVAFEKNFDMFFPAISNKNRKTHYRGHIVARFRPANADWVLVSLKYIGEKYQQDDIVTNRGVISGNPMPPEKVEDDMLPQLQAVLPPQNWMPRPQRD